MSDCTPSPGLTKLSPVQWAACTPEPANVDLRAAAAVRKRWMACRIGGAHGCKHLAAPKQACRRLPAHLLSTKGRRARMRRSAAAVATASLRPYRLWASYCSAPQLAGGEAEARRKGGRLCGGCEGRWAGHAKAQKEQGGKEDARGVVVVMGGVRPCRQPPPSSLPPAPTCRLPSWWRALVGISWAHSPPRLCWLSMA